MGAMLKKLAITLGFMSIAALGSAATALADPAPSPSGDDVSSYGSWGDANFGGSTGMDGYSFHGFGVDTTSSGWPITHTVTTGVLGDYDATTNYATKEGGVEHWFDYKSPDGSVAFKGWYETGPGYAGGVASDSTIRWGSTQYVCHDYMCTVSGS